jgi:hypothetical protein
VNKKEVRKAVGLWLERLRAAPGFGGSILLGALDLWATSDDATRERIFQAAGISDMAFAGAAADVWRSKLEAADRLFKAVHERKASFADLDQQIKALPLDGFTLHHLVHLAAEHGAAREKTTSKRRGAKGKNAEARELFQKQWQQRGPDEYTSQDDFIDKMREVFIEKKRQDLGEKKAAEIEKNFPKNSHIKREWFPKYDSVAKYTPSVKKTSCGC